MMRNGSNGTALWCAALLALIVLGTAVSASATGTAPTVKVFFGQGEQLVAVSRPGATVQDALTALVAGPTSAEQKQSFRSYVPAGTRVRSVTQTGAVATVDLGVGFLQGPAVDTTLSWWQQDVVDAGKWPLMLCFLAFVTTFLATRGITRLIRAGRGPFRNLVTSSGTHIHHSVPGIILLIVGAFIAVATAGLGVWFGIAAVMIGAGVSLVLDEFALILHLEDVYWTNEGRLSVNLVSLTAA